MAEQADERRRTGISAGQRLEGVEEQGAAAVEGDGMQAAERDPCAETLQHCRRLHAVHALRGLQQGRLGTSSLLSYCHL